MSHYYTNSAILPTKRRSNTTLTQQYESTEQKLDLSPQSAPNLVVFMGPITRENHERLLQQQQQRSKDTTAATNIELDDHGDIKQPLLKPFRRLASLDNSSSKPMYRALISLDIILIGILLVRILPIKTISSSVQELMNWYQIYTSHVVAATSIEPFTNTTINTDKDMTRSQFVLSIMKDAFYPFLLFVPAMLSAAVALTSIEGRMIGSFMSMSRILTYTSMVTAGLFIFFSTMVGFAEYSRWTMLGVTSVITPIMLMLLTRLSVVYANGSSNEYAHSMTVWCNNRLPWCGIAGKDVSQHYVMTATLLFGFVFVFIPFLAGLFYAISPPFLLAVPASSLATCALTGMLGIIPMLLSILVVGAGAMMTFWTLTKLFLVYEWAVEKSFSTILFLTIVALLMMITGELNMKLIPTYL